MRQGEVPRSIKRPGLKREFSSCQDLGLQVHQAKAGIPGQIIEIGAGGGGWLVPWVKKRKLD